jgi:hypothetical protein
VNAAEFNVAADDVAGLIAAINNANDEEVNPGADTIRLAADSTYTLTAANNGDTGLPVITSEITIQGNGATVECSTTTGTPAFRLFTVDGTGNLTIDGLTVHNGLVSGERPSGHGGGIVNDGPLTVTDSTLSGNGAGIGGGIYNRGAVTLANSTVSENTAAQFAGGIDITDGTVTLTSTIVANNEGPSPDCLGSGTFTLTDGGGNLSSDGSCPGLVSDPLLGPLQNNGGPTFTHALLFGSPAIDAAPTCAGLTTDPRGVARPQHTSCDIGAFEGKLSNYTFSGFFSPVDNLPVVNVVKAGQGVLVKFSLNSNQGLDLFVEGYPLSQKTVCESGTPSDDIDQMVNAGSSSLQYDPATDTYTYVWATKKAWTNTCRQLIVRLDDGTDHVALFRFK